MKSHKTHAKALFTSLDPLALLAGLSLEMIAWLSIFGAWSAAVGSKGFVPNYELERFEHEGLGITDEVIDQLIAAGKWQRVKHGIEIVDWHITQASDAVEEKHYEDLDEPSYNEADAEAVRASVRAAMTADDREDVQDSDSDGEPESAADDEDSEQRPASELERIVRDSTSESVREQIESSTDHKLHYADELPEDKPKFEYTRGERRDAYDEFLSIVDLVPEEKGECLKMFREDLEHFGIKVLIEAAEEMASRTDRRERPLPEEWLKSDGVQKYVDSQTRQ